MHRPERDTPVRLADLPYLTTRRACALADCSRATLRRAVAPVGRRGRTDVYRTADVLAWLSGGQPDAPEPRKATPRNSSAMTADALERLRAIKAGVR